MELRLLTTEVERDAFRIGMREARASKGGKFRETARSRVSDIQMAFARLYGIFDEANRSYLLGGYSIHCLDEFSQSFPIPNLSHLPPSAVYEAGQLWAVSHDAARALRRGSMILLGLLQAEALLIYPLIVPRDVSILYRVFRRVGPPFELPFAETATGGKVYMQAMLLEGDELRRQVDMASSDGFETRAGHSVIRFDTLKGDSPNVVENARWYPRCETLAGVPDVSASRSVARPATPAGRWSWCDYATDERCPTRADCDLQCRDKASPMFDR